jgi:uncharacterized protein YcbX
VYVKELWRYPVKSLGGESLAAADLTLDGVRGDRLVHVRGDRGPLTGRSRHQLLTIPASTGADGAPLVVGHPWDSPAAAEIVAAKAGGDARLRAFAGPERFDVLNLSVATDGAVDELGIDIRRLRPNILIGGLSPAAERSWPGRVLAVGDARIGLHALRHRCIATTIDPDSGEQDVGVLRRIRERYANQVTLDSWVIRPGAIRVGDRVELTGERAFPGRIGGWIVGAPYLEADDPQSVVA